MAEPAPKQIWKDVDPDILAEFKSNLQDHCETIEVEVAKLGKNPSDQDAVHKLFRALHSVKGDATVCQLTTLAKFAHGIENVVGEVRAGKLPYTASLGEAVMLALDKLKEIADRLMRQQDVDENEIEDFQFALSMIQRANSVAEVAKEAGKVSELVAGVIHTVQHPQPPLPKIPVQVRLSNPRRSDLDYFKSLSLMLEAKMPYWQGRSERILAVALDLNSLAGNLVNNDQLEAAVLLHDLGYAFLPDALLTKEGKYSDDERKLMQGHPDNAAGLLRRMRHWDEAAQIVEQHHGRPDAKGYPAGLDATNLSVGAKILAIVDAFEAMTHPRPDRQYKRSMLRALTEINANAGTQFCDKLVPLFNTVVRQRFGGH